MLNIMKLIFFNEHNKKIQKDLQAIETAITYPFGADDRFYISHGHDYFRFFLRLGTPYWAALLDAHHKICGQLCAIMRKVPTAAGKWKNAWYLCDLKKGKHAKHTHTLSRLFRTLFWRLIWKCQRGYAVSMNLPSSVNLLEVLVKKQVFLPFISTSPLTLFSCSYEELKQLLPLLEAHRGPIGYLNLEGIKDIVLQKQGKRPFIHLQFGPLKAASNCTPLPGYTYMWCSPTHDPLTQALLEAGYAPTATATIFSFRMKQNPWSWILTSEI